MSIWGHAQSLAIGFYNCENLYDTLDDAHVMDQPFTPQGVKKFTTKVYNEKIQHIAYVVSRLNALKDFTPLALLGLAEIENKSVLDDIIHDSTLQHLAYKYIHYDYRSTSKSDVIDEWIKHILQLADNKINTIKNPVSMKELTREQLKSFKTDTICNSCKKPLYPWEYKKVEYNQHAIHLKCKPNDYNSKRIEDFESFKNESLCYLCKKTITPYKDERVRDHDHVTGEYREACHNHCNLNLQLPNFMPIFFHNF